MTKPKKHLVEARALRAKMEARAVKDGNCLLWTGSVRRGVPVSDRLSVRRLLWVAENGPLPHGKRLGCSCHEPLCIAKAHSILRGYGEGISGPARHHRAERSAKLAASQRARSSTKLDIDKARAIRASTKSAAALAREYGVSAWAVTLIRRGELWREAANGASVFSWGGIAA